MKTIDKIPISKIQRASKLVTTGAKVGVNYIKYYGDKIISSEDEVKARLNENNAEDIYDSLKQLKGSALKVAQMLSMEKSILPQAYVDKFSLAQFSVPPLSPALVLKTFKKYAEEPKSVRKNGKCIATEGNKAAVIKNEFFCVKNLDSIRGKTRLFLFQLTQKLFNHETR